MEITRIRVLKAPGGPGMEGGREGLGEPQVRHQLQVESRAGPRSETIGAGAPRVCSLQLSTHRREIATKTPRSFTPGVVSFMESFYIKEFLFPRPH